MKIGIDISPVIYGTGVSNYTRNLVNALLEIGKEDEFVLFGGSLRRRGELKNTFEGYPVKALPLPPTVADMLWNRLHILPVEWLIGKVDVFHSSDWAQPPTKAYKVTTIHDLVSLRFPKISHPKVVSTHKARLRWVKEEVDKIIAVSDFTKQEIVELLGIKPERITVIPEAPDEIFKPSGKQEVDKIKRKYKILGNYLLVVGADPRKNIPAVIQAFGRVRKQTGLNLVIVGRPWEKVPQVPGILHLGHVSREEMPALYSGASALVYTSLYEGFGLPILEAMACGTPVVTSNISSMPEVAGDVAILVDPTNPVEIAEGIEKAVFEKRKWGEAGRKRVRRFSWRKTAQMTLEVYHQL